MFYEKKKEKRAKIQQRATIAMPTFLLTNDVANFHHGRQSPGLIVYNKELQEGLLGDSNKIQRAKK